MSRCSKHWVSHKPSIVVWHINRFELAILRELLQPAEYINTLPPQENRIRMIKALSSGLGPRDKTGRVFNPKLDQLFHLLYAGHHFVGMNYNAAPEIKMFRLMIVLLYFNLWQMSCHAYHYHNCSQTVCLQILVLLRTLGSK